MIIIICFICANIKKYRYQFIWPLFYIVEAKQRERDIKRKTQWHAFEFKFVLKNLPNWNICLENKFGFEIECICKIHRLIELQSLPHRSQDQFKLVSLRKKGLTSKNWIFTSNDHSLFPVVVWKSPIMQIIFVSMYRMQEGRYTYSRESMYY